MELILIIIIICLLSKNKRLKNDLESLAPSIPQLDDQSPAPESGGMGAGFWILVLLMLVFAVAMYGANNG